MCEYNKMREKISNGYIDNELMSLKNDFVFKLIFGDEKNKRVLIAFLSAVLGLEMGEFLELEFLNTELLKEFKEDKKGILDVRVKTRTGTHIDIEIQVLPTEFMAERTVFYWSKMFTSQIKSGDTYEKLKKWYNYKYSRFCNYTATKNSYEVSYIRR